MNILIGAFFVISQLKCSNSSNFRHQESLGGEMCWVRRPSRIPHSMPGRCCRVHYLDPAPCSGSSLDFVQKDQAGAHARMQDVRQHLHKGKLKGKSQWMNDIIPVNTLLEARRVNGQYWEWTSGALRAAQRKLKVLGERGLKSSPSTTHCS